MKLKVYYSVQNGGDGSAYIELMESRDLAELDQGHIRDDEGFAEECIGWITLESDAPIKLLDEVSTVDSLIKEIEDDYEEGSEYYPKDRMAALKALKAKQEK